MKRYVVGISGASGVVLAVKLVKHLAVLGHHVDVIISPAAMKTLYYEMGESSFISLIPKESHKHVVTHSIKAIESPLASGSYHVEGTIIVPCSMATVAALSIGLGDNLLRRVADVALKERRKLILVPREAPLHSIHLENLLKLSQNGAIIFPPMPMWYFTPKTVEEVTDQLVGKMLSLLGIDNTLAKVWQLPS
ncbi:polyprenyl P-hydroxybenzoate and phenylacrylic acid decarboxylase family protein [Chlamydia ibidis]|uniref:Flavin prenyltransferase UbiX n=2 Tax=Chlamydia ibidis TaxID=1405396 RepID=S7J4X7_9CHLA|nr:flavin prenyltransferase UbiX [Chlamydia ibidis]EPP35102.1 polyprenyl P-hydroxybenzoate and phenylacrylic acid decarboxylase family protein [Chlamydia ibidis]EQM62755.1 phenolic acid decarboxylase subunit B [Chlamydia ibidis 10-1398/6]